MTPHEISYRLRAKLQSEAERIHAYFGAGEMTDSDFSSSFPVAGRDTGNQFFSFVQYLCGAPAARFYFPAAGTGRERLLRLWSHGFSHWTETAVEDAEKLCAHKIELLGLGEIELGAEINWHRDPVTGRVWERRFWADYDPVRDCAAGDPKTIYELNRHQHLPRLAKAYFLTGEERYAHEAIAQIESWIEQNPPSFGINWHSSLDIGLRTISWLWSLFFLLPTQALDERSARRIGKSLFAQLDHVYRNLSLFTSPNTHLIGEATALLLAGLIFAEFKRARAWLETGAKVLMDEMSRQVSSEGVHAELSTYYHCYALDFYLQALILARRNCFDFPDWVWSSLSRMTEFLMHVARPNSSIPVIGDDDGGRALALCKGDYRSFRDALCAGAILYRRPDFKHQAGDFCEETFWLLGEEGWRVYGLLESAPPAETHGFYPAAGYFVQRSDWGPIASHLAFDCGGLGNLGGGHGHADALSVVLSAGGRELLVDPGTFVYGGSPEWRNFFRSTRAHNTVVVDGRDQSECGGTFRWNSKARAHVLKQLALPAIEYVEGEHDGYSNFPRETIHRRRLAYLRPDYWVVVDDFRGCGEHSFDFYYHFSPEAEPFVVREHDRELDLVVRFKEAGLLLFLTASHSLQAEMISGQSTSIQGWVSARYGEKRPAPVLRASLSACTPAGAITVLVPFARVQPLEAESTSRLARSVAVEGNRAVACEVKISDRRDLFVLSLSDSELEIAGFKLRGEFFWLRVEREVLTELLAVNARSLRRGDTTLFEHREPVSYTSIGMDDKATGVDDKVERELCAEYAG